jgi:hypothetical protein
MLFNPPCEVLKRDTTFTTSIFNSPVSRRKPTETVPIVLAPTATLASDTALLPHILEINPRGILGIVCDKRASIRRPAKFSNLRLSRLATEPGRDLLNIREDETVLVICSCEIAVIEVVAGVLNEVDHARVVGISPSPAQTNVSAASELRWQSGELHFTQVREGGTDVKADAIELQRAIRIHLLETAALTGVQYNLAAVLLAIVQIELLRGGVVVGPDFDGEGGVAEVGLDDLVVEPGPHGTLVRGVDVGERLDSLAEVLFEELCALDWFEMC